MKQVHIDIINKVKRKLKSMWYTSIVLGIIGIIVAILFVIPEIPWEIPMAILCCIDVIVVVIMLRAASLQKRLEDYEQTHKND
jgi:hypothetical protein